MGQVDIPWPTLINEHRRPWTVAKLILPRSDLLSLIRHRRRCGGDRYDEVWDGVYVMSPLADNEHQDLVLRLAIAIRAGFDESQEVRVFPGTNVSDRPDRWKRNFRCPDVAVFLPGNPAEDRGSHWFGGPDFAVEIISRGDRSREKFDFYAAVGVRELLLINRRPWRLELYRREGETWHRVGNSTPEDSVPLPSDVLSITLRLLPGNPRPQLELARAMDGQRWLA